MTFKVYDADEHPYVCIYHNGREVFSMSIDSVNSESRDWVCKQLDQQITTAINNSFQNGYAHAQQVMRSSLGLEK